MNEKIFLKSLSKLFSYLLSWSDSCGRFFSPIIHRGNLKRIGNIHETPWLQSPIIDSLISLSKANEYWSKLLNSAIEVQCFDQSSDGLFKFSGHEDDRYSSLVHNSLADISLLKYIQVTRNRQYNLSKSCISSDKVSSAVERNVEYLLVNLYNKKIGACKMDVNDYYFQGKERYILNMNAVFLESLTLLSVVKSSNDVKDVIKSLSNFIYKIIFSYGEKNIPYSQEQRDIEINIYTAILGNSCLNSIENIKTDTNFSKSEKNDIISKLLFISKVCAKRLKLMEIPDKKGLFYHGTYSGKLVKFPVFVAGSSIILNFLIKFNFLAGDNEMARKYINSIVPLLNTYQYNSGGIRNFIGYNTKDNFRTFTGFSVWEDSLPTPGWNAYFFQLLTSLLSTEMLKKIRVTKKIPVERKLSLGYFWKETYDKLIVLSVFPPKSSAFYIFNKQKESNIIWFDLRRVKSIFVKDYFCN